MTEDYPRTLLELEQRFSDEAACRAYLFKLRWPQGFICPECRGQKVWPMNGNPWLCAGCRWQVSVTAGTVLQDSRLPLMVWFRAMWQVTAQKNGMSAMGLQRVLGLGSYKTAWTLLHKLRRAMGRPGRVRLRGVVEVDEAYWGGEEEDVRGRETYQKALIASASGPRARASAGFGCYTSPIRSGRHCTALLPIPSSRAALCRPTDSKPIAS